MESTSLNSSLRGTNAGNGTIGMNSLYRTSNSEYATDWQYKKSIAAGQGEIPTYSEIGKMLPDIRRQEKLIRNQLVARSRSKQEAEENLDEISRLRIKLDKNAVVAKNFPVKPESLKYPELSLIHI
eukprot:TRINITY_DN6063_c0_g1_i1.p1 TRINITY_DN6063_c0_g1~~TRINITY_DN6063_c0_g1_i1.p1  ORF type:complete len:126 (-),score=29.59 TRINITY_DN6063_c0_g1_i1:60-437(-)